MLSLGTVMIGGTNLNAAEPTGRVRLQLKWLHQFQFAGYYAAESKGYFAAEGLQVEILEGGPQRPPLKRVLDGETQYGVSDTDVLQAHLRGQPIVVCATIFQHSPYVIMSRADQHIRTPHDLVGKKIMMADDQGADQLRAMLAKEGIAEQRVNVVPHSWDLADLIEGRVDAVSAYATVEPIALRQRGVEPALIRSSDYGVDFYGDALFTTTTEVTRQPARVAAMVRATRRGWDYAFGHPDEIADLILRIDGVVARGITREQLLEEARTMRDYVLPDVVEIGHMNPDRWLQIARLLAGSGSASRKINLEGFIYDPNAAYDYRRLWWIPAALAVVLAGIGLVLLWNIQIRRQVRNRTRELQMEVTQRRRVMAELQLSEERFRQLTENIHEVFWLTDPTKNETLYISPAYDTIWGRPHQQLYDSPRDWLDAIHPTDQARITEAIVTKQAAGTYDEEFRIVRPDGSIRWIHDRAFPVRNAAGMVHRIAGVAEDITERKRIEEALRTARETVRTIFDSAPVAILGLDLQGRITNWNAGATRMFGWSEAEVLGTICPMVPADGLEDFSAMIERVAQQGPQAGLIFPWQKRNGERIRASLSSAPLRNPAGTVIGVMVILEDVTARLRTQEALQQTEGEQRQLAQQLATEKARLVAAQAVAKVGSWETDVVTGTVTWSDETHRIFETDPRAFQPTHAAFVQLVHPDDRAMVDEAFVRSLAVREPCAIEHRVQLPDGRSKIVEERWQIFFNDRGQPIRAVGTCQDITEAKRAEAELRAAEQQLHALVGRLHNVREDEAKRIARELHDDLGQRLTALNMELAGLEATLPGATPAQRNQIARMRAGVDHTIEVVQKISGELRLGQLDMLGLTAAIDWHVKEFAKRSAIPCKIVRLDECPDLPDAEATAVFRLLQEALTNIARHAGATEVEVTLAAGPDTLTLRVHDNGRGITAAELSDRKAIGLLGMRERAQIVGGKVTITGAVGAGTTVIVSIPLNRTGALPA